MATATVLAPLQPEMDGSSGPVPRSETSSTTDRSPSPPTEGSDNEDNMLYGEPDDAQSIIQPAMSPVATRLTSPKTPAAEKAAALEGLPGGGLFDAIIPDTASPPSLAHMSWVAPPPFNSLPTRSTTPAVTSPRKLSKADPSHVRERGKTMGQLPSPQPRGNDLPSPWESGPKSLVVDEASQGSRTAVAGVYGNQTRAHRASSIGENALKRLSKAFDSISIPAHLLPNLSTPSFLSTNSPPKGGCPLQSPNASSSSMVRRGSSQLLTPASPTFSPSPSQIEAVPPMSEIPRATRQPSVASRKSQLLRRSMSDDSLYTTLSRVSSFGDDERFTHVREQINSRFKAIKDSWDGPSFKMPQLPQLPSILPAPLRKQSSMTPEPPPDMSRQVQANAPREPPSPLDAVLETLTGDIVVMGGYRGSILRSAEGPPHRRLWAPVKVGLNIRKVNLEVGLDPEDEENMEQQIFPSGMLQNIGPVDISRRFFKKLRECDNARKGKLRIYDYGYDWRLSPHLLSRKLVQFLATLPSNSASTPAEHKGALVIAHSLGGMITRHAVNQRPDLFSGVVYAGAPQRCINILGPIRNGDAVMLNEKVLTAPVNFSLRTSFVFLPEDGYCFVDKVTKEEYRVDFYDVNNWIRYRLSPCIGEAPVALTRQGALSSLLNLSDLGLRARSNSQSKNGQSTTAHGAESSPNVFVEAAQRATANFTAFKDRTLAPQMQHAGGVPLQQSQPAPPFSGGLLPDQQRHLEYLTRTLADTKRFRAELQHRPEHQAANAYPPLAVMYGKDTPTTAGAKVVSREAIASTEAYDELFFGSGDGVVLAKQAMLPPGYELARGGRICTDRGHISMLGDLQAVGRAMQAVTRGRRKGIGLGVEVGRGQQPGAGGRGQE